MRASLSIVTPTFNRANTLPRTFESLKQQTVAPHEWIIVDDGSTDGTRDLVSDWQRFSPFPIVYLWQENSGKPSAHNLGVKTSRADLVAILDSDDWCEPNAVQRLIELWHEIPEGEREGFTGISVHSADVNGHLIGSFFPQSPIDSTLAEMAERGWLSGDKWGFHRRDVLLQFPFPVIQGEKFVPEGLVWNRIGNAYRMRFVNEVLNRKEYRADGLSRGRWRNLMRSPKGFQIYYAERAQQSHSFKARTYATANNVRFSLHAARADGVRPCDPFGGLIFIIGAIAGFAMWAADHLRTLVARDDSSAKARGPKPDHALQES
jgi:glycosyltransferase involved in cell wall biosynthesis